MKEILNQCLQSEFEIPRTNIEMITSFFKMRDLDGGSLIVKKGQVVNFIAFVASGVVRTYEYDEAGNDTTTFFFRENQFVTNLDSYINAVPSQFFIEAVTRCTLFTIKKEDTLQLPGWPHIFNHLVQKTLIHKVQEQNILRTANAKEKYKTFLHNNGTLINQVPLHHIASYLGMTPQSLSRVRRAL